MGTTIQRMSLKMNLPDDPNPGFAERRAKPRIQCSYPAVVRTHVPGGGKVVAQAILSNMSANGMYLRSKHSFQPGESLLIMVRMSTTPLNQDTVPVIAAKGIVTRSEPHTGGVFGIGLKLTHHRFL